MDCKCEADNTEDATVGWWLSSGNVQMGAFTVVGYLLYRFSQTLPALIRWPIRLFCSLTGLSALWGWVSRLVGTLRGIRSFIKFLTRIWRFVVGSSQAEQHPSSMLSLSDEVRLILLGPSHGGRTSIGNTLLDYGATKSAEPLMESRKWRAVVDGQVVTVIDTPDLLGQSLGKEERAREALRSLQLASPGPHSLLLVLPAPGSNMNAHHNALQLIRAIQDLFGEGASTYIIPVLTHADCLARRPTVDQLLDMNAGGLETATSLCGQRPELVSNRPDHPPEEQSATRRGLLGRVREIKVRRGHFVHELQRREDNSREELLSDMADALARKLRDV